MKGNNENLILPIPQAAVKGNFNIPADFYFLESSQDFSTVQLFISY